jgi:hypothetical protein
MVTSSFLKIDGWMFYLREFSKGITSEIEIIMRLNPKFQAL